MRVCAEPDCGQLATGRRCFAHARQFEAQRLGREIYDAAWAAESRALRRAEPWCHAATHAANCRLTEDLTVDHPTRLVLSRSCHAVLENERRRDFSRKG